MNQLQLGSVLWQEGYGAVTFRRSELEKVVSYVAEQEARHGLKALSPMLKIWYKPDEEDEPRP